MNLILSPKKSCYLYFAAATDKWLDWNNIVYYAQFFARMKKRLFVELEIKDLNKFLTEEFSRNHG